MGLMLSLREKVWFCEICDLFVFCIDVKSNRYL
jgi:hypothetical protein